MQYVPKFLLHVTLPSTSVSLEQSFSLLSDSITTYFSHTQCSINIYINILVTGASLRVSVGASHDEASLQDTASSAVERPKQTVRDCTWIRMLKRPHILRKSDYGDFRLLNSEPYSSTQLGSVHTARNVLRLLSSAMQNLRIVSTFIYHTTSLRAWLISRAHLVHITA